MNIKPLDLAYIFSSDKQILVNLFLKWGLVPGDHYNGSRIIANNYDLITFLVGVWIENVWDDSWM